MLTVAPPNMQQNRTISRFRTQTQPCMQSWNAQPHNRSVPQYGVVCMLSSKRSAKGSHGKGTGALVCLVGRRTYHLLSLVREERDGLYRSNCSGLAGWRVVDDTHQIVERNRKAFWGDMGAPGPERFAHLSAIPCKYALVWANLPEAKSCHPLHPCIAGAEDQAAVLGGGLARADFK